MKSCLAYLLTGRDPTSGPWADPGTGEIMDYRPPKGLKVLSDPLKKPQSFMENERLSYEKRSGRSRLKSWNALTVLACFSEVRCGVG